jgi:excisionase family DNA binding protein
MPKPRANQISFIFGMEYIYSENKSGRRYVKASVIAQYYDITPPTVYRWANEGHIPSVRFENTIRFNFEAVKAAIEGEEVVK